jgi:hypothetical protein
MSAIATSLRLIGCWENVWDDTCMYDCSKEYVSSMPKGQIPDLSLVLGALMEEPL